MGTRRRPAFGSPRSHDTFPRQVLPPRSEPVAKVFILVKELMRHRPEEPLARHQQGAGYSD